MTPISEYAVRCEGQQLSEWTELACALHRWLWFLTANQIGSGSPATPITKIIYGIPTRILGNYGDCGREIALACEWRIWSNLDNDGQIKQPRLRRDARVVTVALVESASFILNFIGLRTAR